MNWPSKKETVNYIAKAELAAWQVPKLSKSTQKRSIQKVGIIGAGTMGGGISMNFATAGFDVIIVENNAEALQKGLSVVRANYQRSADKGRFPQAQVEARMSLLRGASSLEELSNCDLIIEAVFENMDLKCQIFSALDKIAKPGAILPTNTAALDIDEIASVSSRPQYVIGLYFLSPANVIKLLEIVRAKKDRKYCKNFEEFDKKINKIVILIVVFRGFVGSRILLQDTIRDKNFFRKVSCIGIRMP